MNYKVVRLDTQKSGWMTFICENYAYEIEITPFTKFVKINNRIIFNLTKKDDSPIQVKKRNINGVVKVLENYCLVEKKMNKLISFFAKLQEGEYIYIYPMKIGDECVEIMQESLKYYNQGVEDNNIILELEPYLNKMSEGEAVQSSIRKNYELFY